MGQIQKAKLELSNFLWLDNNLPLELQDTIIPEKELNDKIKITLKTDGFVFDEAQLVNHPKIKALENKIQILDIERKLKVNSLLPKINLDYQYLSVPQSFTYSNFLYNNFNDYKLGMMVFVKNLSAEQIDRLQKSLQKDFATAMNQQDMVGSKIAPNKTDIDQFIATAKLIFL